jgi:hypothetical protein
VSTIPAICCRLAELELIERERRMDAVRLAMRESADESSAFGQTRASLGAHSVLNQNDPHLSPH